MGGGREGVWSVWEGVWSREVACSKESLEYWVVLWEVVGVASSNDSSSGTAVSEGVWSNTSLITSLSSAARVVGGVARGMMGVASTAFFGVAALPPDLW